MRTEENITMAWRKNTFLIAKVIWSNRIWWEFHTPFKTMHIHCDCMRMTILRHRVDWASIVGTFHHTDWLLIDASCKLFWTTLHPVCYCIAFSHCIKSLQIYCITSLHITALYYCTPLHYIIAQHCTAILHEDALLSDIALSYLLLLWG